MRFLIIGLGSMGKRRVRNLQALNAGEIIGFDLKDERCLEAEEKYGIRTVNNIDLANLAGIDALIISTPPDRHNEWIEFAINNKKPAFIEASVILAGLPELKRKADENRVLIVPSSTLHFHPAIEVISEIVASGKYGKVVNFSYHMGAYLPDWHPWEKVGDSYTGKKETNGVREMVAFELTWLVKIMGYPRDIIGFYGRTTDLGADVDDTYAIAIKFDEAFATLLVDTTSRYHIRHLIMNFKRAQILWRWDRNVVMLYDAERKEWFELSLPEGKAADGYNPNITEEMYTKELSVFIKAVRGNGEFPNSLEKDIKILDLLHKIERGVE